MTSDERTLDPMEKLLHMSLVRIKPMKNEVTNHDREQWKHVPYGLTLTLKDPE